MKLRIVTAALMSILIATVAFAECPDNVGTFTTMNGTMLGGRVSEAQCGGGAGQPGNIQNAMSWDGLVLGSEWVVQGMIVDAAGAVEIARSMDAMGNGWIEYRTDYDGGTFWLSKDGAWGDGYQDLTGDIQNYTVTVKVTYVMGNHVGATSNIYFTGTFTDCPAYNGCMIEYAIANAMENPWADPAQYPDALCQADADLYDVCCITTSMSCVVSGEEKSFGEIKAQYR